MESRISSPVAALAGVALLGAAVCVGCNSQAPDPGADTRELRVAVLPGQKPEELRRRYLHLIDYLRVTLDRPIQLEIPSSYRDLGDRFDAGEFDLAWFGGVTFTRARHRSGAEPLVMRDIDRHFASVFLAAADAPQQLVRDFRGMSLSFGPRLSTSGHVMPRFHLTRRGIDPDTFFGKVKHSRGHDETAGWVQDGTVDLGVVDETVLAAMLRDGRLDPSRVRVVETTPPYQNYVWATRSGIDPALRETLLDAFLALDPALPAHQLALDAVGASGFLPASDPEFDQLQVAVSSFGLLGEL